MLELRVFAKVTTEVDHVVRVHKRHLQIDVTKDSILQIFKLHGRITVAKGILDNGKSLSGVTKVVFSAS